MASVVKHQKFVCTEVARNANKFWEIWEFSDGSIKTRWGRVSDKDKAQEKTYPPGQKNYESLVKAKLKVKSHREPYTEVTTVGDAEGGGTVAAAAKAGKKVNDANLEDLAAKQIGRGNKLVEGLVKYLARKNRHTITQNTSITYNEATGLFQTPLGVITADMISDARTLLADLFNFVQKGDYENKKYHEAIAKYLRLVPTDVGRKRDWYMTFLPNANAVQAQSSILDALQASLDMVVSGKAKKSKSKTAEPEQRVFDVLVEPINDDKEINRIKKKYDETRQRQHMAAQFGVKKAYSVQVASMASAFERDGKKVGNIKELWHGSQASNILSILAKGMMIPPSSASHVCGRMFGDGLYFSDQSTKSLNYAAGYWGGNRDNTCFMFLVDVAMGKEYIPRGAFGGRPPAGFDSTFAKAGRSGVMNNESIVYRTSQANLVRLVEFSV